MARMRGLEGQGMAATASGAGVAMAFKRTLDAACVTTGIPHREPPPLG
ncbi:hypothetical protein [Allorhodopirellula heiligendammensis]|nr:hypothetical protein [Allorhodopirellula heiligendammensis]